jgi:(p)ppGpp synthase/HD superfamily hydrolase
MFAMIAVLKRGTTPEQTENLIQWLKRMDMDVHISGVNAKSGKDGMVNITLTLSITSTMQMQRVLRNLRHVQNVTNVYRARA